MEHTRERWIPAALLVGVLYAGIGILFAIPSTHVRGWRLAAWIVSALVFAAHIGFERFGLRAAPRRAAVHVALAAALGAFGLAVGANVHSLAAVSPVPHRSLLIAALVVWPAITGVPAFLVALAVGEMLAHVPWKRGHGYGT